MPRFLKSLFAPLFLLVLLVIAPSAQAGRPVRYVFDPARAGEVARNGEVSLVFTADRNLAEFGAAWIEAMQDAGTPVDPLAERISATVEAGDPVDFFEATWSDADGISHSVKTYHRAGETVKRHVERHKERVALLREAFPPVPPPPAGGGH